MYTPVIVPAPTSEQNNVDLHKVVLQLEALKDERERYMKEVKTEVLEINEGTMDSLRTAHAATVEAFRAAHAATVAAKDEQINSLKGGGNDALQREHEARMNRLRDQYRTDLQQQEQRSARDKDAQDQELQRVRREHEMALTNLKQAYDANIATKDEMIDALKRAHVQVQEAATAAASRESPEQQQQRLAELAHRTQAIASEIAQREQQIAADITHRLAQQAAEERQHRLNDRSAMTNDGAALNALKDRHADAMRALSASHADTVAAKDDIIAMLQGKPPPPRNNPYNNNYNPYGGASSGMLADPRDRSYADSAPYDRSGRGPYPRDDHLIDAYGQRAPPRGYGDEFDGGRQQRSPYGSNRDPPSARYGRGGATHRYGDGDGDDDDGGYGYARRAPPTPTLEDRLQEEMRRQRGQLPQFWQAAEPMANWHKADDAGALADVLRDQRGVREVDTTNSPTTPALGYLEYLLSQLPQLETLTMDLGAYRFVRDPHAMDAVRRPFSKLRILRLRHCSNAALADMVKVLRHGCPKLEEIQLQQCKQLTDIYPLVDLPHVAKLDVKDSGVGDIFKVMREPTRPTSSVPRSSTNTTAREDPRSKRRDNKRNDDDDDDERARSSARSKSDEKSARQREKDREREERHRKKEEERQRQREKEREREERAARKKNEADQRQREKEEKERKKEEAERERSARKKEREREERAARKKEEADQRQREKDEKERERSARKKERENEKQRQQERQLAKDAKQREKEKEKERKQREKDRKRTPSPSSTKHSPTRSRNSSSSSSSGASAHRTPTPRSAKPSTPPSATRDSQGYWQHDDRGSAQPQDPRYSVDRSSHQPLSCSERAELSDRENSPARHQQQPSRSSASSAAGDTPGSSDADSSHNNSGGSASKSMGLNEETLRGEPAVSPEKTPRKSSSKSSHQPSRQPSGALRSGDHSTPRKPSQQLSAQPSSAQQLRSGDRSAPLHSQPSSGVKSRSSPQQQKDALRSPKRTSTGSSDSDRPSSVPTSSTATTLSSVGARHMDRRELPPLPSPDHVQVLSTQQLYPPINYTAAYGIMFELESRVDIILEEIFFEPMASRPRGAARWFWREGGLENMEIHPDEWYEVGKQPKIKLIEGNLYSAGRLALPMKAGQRYSIYESINDGVGLKVMKNIMGHLGKIGDLYKRDRSLAIFVGRFSGPPAPFCNLGSEEFPVAFCGRITYQLADGASPKKSKSGEAKKDKKKRK